MYVTTPKVQVAAMKAVKTQSNHPRIVAKVSILDRSFRLRFRGFPPFGPVIEQDSKVIVMEYVEG
jgi:hypothetical protein